MANKTSYIPSRLKSISKEDPYIAGSEDIVDDDLGRSQRSLNAEMKSITDQMVVAIDGGSVLLSGNSDDISPGSGKIPNGNAVYQALSEKPDITINPGNTTGVLNSIGINGINYGIEGSGGSGGEVISVNGRSGEVTIDAEDIGAIPSVLIGNANGIATLDALGKILDSQLPFNYNNYATKDEISELISSNVASTSTCIDVINELI